MTADQPDMDNARPRRMRKLGVTLFVVAVLLTLLGIFHLIENWRGKAKWERLKRELVAKGEQLDLVAFVPPPIPPEQNFAATPFFAELFPGPKPTNWNSRHWPEGFLRLNPPTVSGRLRERQVTDMVAWQTLIRGTNGAAGSSEDRAKAAEAVLAALKPYEPALTELRAAAGRPRSRYDVEYTMGNPWGIRLPHLPVIKEVARVLSVKACAELATGKSERAMEDVRVMACLVRSMDSEIFLINYLVEVAALQLMLQPVWEGLALGSWSDAQLQELQNMLMQFNFVGQLALPLKAERAAGILTVEILMSQRYKVEFIEALTGQQQGGAVVVRNALALLVPRGWYRMEQVEYTRLSQEFMLPGADGTNRLVYPATVDGHQAQLRKALPGGVRAFFQHRMIARLLMPTVVNVHRRAAEAQTAVHQAAIACALERYRRKHNDYPTDLAALASEFMASVPNDVIGGKPLRYKTGKPFVLYSIAWDEKDNGGTPGKTLWDEKGDWVWTYPQ